MRTPPLVRPRLFLLLVAAASCGDPVPSTNPPPASPTAAPRAPDATAAPTVRTPAELARDAELQPKAAAFLSAFWNDDARLTRSGNVVFLSNREGLAQIYLGDAAHPGDPPRRLPTPAERVTTVTLTAEEHAVLFTSDVGADGNFHIFKVGLDGDGLTDLTPGEKLHRNPPSVARNDPNVMVYSAHAPSSEKTSVFVQALDGTAAREVYSDAHGGQLSDLSPDGKRALFTHENSHQDAVAYEIDLATGRASRVFPPEGAPASVNVAYSATADRIFATTRREGEHAQLFAIDPKTGKPTAHYEETTLPNGEITSVLASPTGDRVAISVDGGNHGEIRLLDARSLKLQKTVRTPLGVATLGDYGKDGKRFTLTESHPDAPTDVFSVDASTGVASPLRNDERPGLAAMAPIKVSIETVPAHDGLPLPVNVYLPSGALPGSGSDAGASAKMPALVSIHGGPSYSSQVRWSGAIRFYLSLGYAFVEPNIRGSTGFGVAFERADDKEKRADALKDVETINRWTRAQPWCDPDRVVIMGGSYGGYMTLLVAGRQPQLWRAGLDVAGMSDLRAMEKLEDQSVRVFDETEFGALGKDDGLLTEWSPIEYVDAITMPLFIYQGANDQVTPQSATDEMVTALRRRNVPVEYMVVANEGHSLAHRETHAEYLARTARFMEEHAAAR